MYNEMIQTEIDSAIETARAFFPNVTFDTPTFEISARMTSTAGKIRTNTLTRTAHIKFSKPLLEQNLADFLERTVWHEVAHYIERMVYGKGGHGQSFYYVMKTVFQKSANESTRCHTYKVERRKTLKYRYTCDACGLKIHMGGQRHNKQQTFRALYKHTACGTGGTLTFVTAERV